MKRLWNLLSSPTARYSLGTIAAVGVALGIVGASSFQVVVHETSTDAFCLSCHAQDIGLEMPGTVHESNSVGASVGCADCHLPHSFWPKVAAKTKAGIKDVYHTALGTIDTPEKFEAHRMHMATITWMAMNENDSRECRYCHDEARWDLTKQTEKSREYHGPALTQGKTCIDCHKGIAHKLPEGIVPDEQLPGIDPVEHQTPRRAIPQGDETAPRGVMPREDEPDVAPERVAPIEEVITE